MREDLPPWARDDASEAEAPASRSRPWLLVLAVVPWLLVLALALGVRTPASSPPSADVPASTDSAEAPTNLDSAEAPEDSDSAEAAEDSDSAEAAEGAGALAAVATAVARAWLTDVGPRLEISGVDAQADLYLEHGVVEHVERHGRHAVVTLLGVVLTRDGEAYTRVSARRLAVPVALDPLRPAGSPWWLGSVELEAVPPEPLVEVDEPEELLAISEALTAAGLSDHELLSASRTSDGWWLAHTGHAADGASHAPVWLYPGPRGPVVAGRGTQEREE